MRLSPSTRDITGKAVLPFIVRGRSGLSGTRLCRICSMCVMKQYGPAVIAIEGAIMPGTSKAIAPSSNEAAKIGVAGLASPNVVRNRVVTGKSHARRHH